jgi:hypothetical protein
MDIGDVVLMRWNVRIGLRHQWRRNRLKYVGRLPRAWFEVMLCRGLGAQWTHVGIVCSVEPLVICEMTQFQMCATNGDDFGADEWQWLVLHPSPWSPAQAARLQEVLTQFAGQRLGVRDVVQGLLRYAADPEVSLSIRVHLWLLSPVLLWLRWWVRPGGYTCTGFVCRALTEAGFPVGMEGPHVLPDDFLANTRFRR